MFRLVILSLVAIVSAAANAAAQARTPTCAIDMGSNTFRRIVASFENGRYEQRKLEKKTMGVGDDVARDGRISDAKLAEIDRVLSAFKAACVEEGAAPVVAIGTAAFRAAKNGAAAVAIASKHGIAMEIATEARESELAYLVGSLGRSGYAVVDNGSQSIELVSRDDRTPRYVVLNLGYRVAYDTFFAAATEPATAVRALRDRLMQEVAAMPFMRGKKAFVGVEFGDMMELLFDPAPFEGRVLTLAQLNEKLAQIVSLPAGEFQALKKKPDIDRALPRLVVAAVLTEAFGYAGLELTERELGTGLIIEAGLKAP